MEYDWSGRTLEVIFPDSLKKNTTYSVSIGAAVADLNNNNKMTEAFNFSFSTGIAIDSCKISGQVFDTEPAGVMIFAYRDKTGKLDISKEEPDYISQVGKNGIYSLTGLGFGEYNVFALRDKLRDYVYKEGEDQIGIPFNPVKMTRDSSKYSDLDFFLSMDDTVKPHINKVVMTDRNHIAVEFSKAVDSTKLKPENFFLIDSTSGKKNGMKYFYKGQGKPYQFFLSFSDSIKSSPQLFLAANNIIDKNGNKLDYEAVSITNNLKTDTSTIKINKILGQYQNDLLDYEIPEIYVQFDHGFNNSAPVEGISVVDSKDKPFRIKIDNIDNSAFKVGFTDKLKPKTELTLKIDLKKFKDFSGKTADSLYKRKFTVINDLDFSGASGIVACPDSSNDIYIVLEKADREKKTYKQKAGKKGEFDLKKVVPGKYLLWSFIDADKDKSYSRGKVNPFTYSEKFKYYPDTLNLRARWPVGDLKIQFDKK